MALTKNTASPKFEDPDGEDTGETRQMSAKERLAAAAAEHAAEQEKEAAQSTSREVAPSPTRAVAIPMAKLNPFLELVNVFPVKFNSLTQIMANQGNFIHKDTNKTMGDTIVMELISTQKHWVLSPGGDTNDEESLPFVKYSDDGITSQDGLDMREQLQVTKDAGYPKAKIAERLILVGCLIDSGKVADLKEKMVQIDLAPSSVAQFDRHQLGVAFAISKGRDTEEGQLVVKMECVIKNQNKLTWTEVSFSKA